MDRMTFEYSLLNISVCIVRHNVCVVLFSIRVAIHLFTIYRVMSGVCLSLIIT